MNKTFEEEIIATLKSLSVQNLANTQIICALTHVIDESALLSLKSILESQSSSYEPQSITYDVAVLAREIVRLAMGDDDPGQKNLLRLVRGGKID